jgi:hypothetical protein
MQRAKRMERDIFCTAGASMNRSSSLTRQGTLNSLFRVCSTT